MDGSLVFAGDLPGGRREAGANGSSCTTVDLPASSSLPPEGVAGQDWAPADPSQELGALLLSPTPPLGNSCLGEPHSGADWEEGLAAAPDSVSTETLDPSSSSSPPDPAGLVHPEDGRSLLRGQMEELSGQNESSGLAAPLTPPLPWAREKSRAGSAKHKAPPWLGLELPAALPAQLPPGRPCLGIPRGSLQPCLAAEAESSSCRVAEEGGKPAVGARKERAAGLDFLTTLCHPEPLLPGRGKEESSKAAGGADILPDKGASLQAWPLPLQKAGPASCWLRPLERLPRVAPHSS